MHEIQVEIRTEGLHSLGKQNVLRDDLPELREVPSIPLASTHRVSVELLVQIIKEG